MTAPLEDWPLTAPLEDWPLTALESRRGRLLRLALLPPLQLPFTQMLARLVLLLMQPLQPILLMQ